MKNEQRILLSSLCHASVLFLPSLAPIVLPVIIYFSSEDAVVREHALNAVNYAFTVFLGVFLIATSAVFLPLGAVFAAVLFFLPLTMIQPVLALFGVFRDPEAPRRYRLCLRLFKRL